MKTIYYNEKKISQIGLGAGRFGTRVEKSLSFQMLDYFYDNGGNVIDTARNYYEWVENGRGMSEKCIGEWMEYRKNRSNICLCTKGGVRNEGKEFISNLSEQGLKTEVQESLETLRTNYLDVYLLHRDEPERPVEEIVETMQEIKDIANVSTIGVANWKIDRVKVANQYALEHNMEPFKIVQTWWSLAEYTDSMWNDSTTTHMDKETYEYILENDYLGMAYTSQCKGFFQKAIQLGIEKLDPFLVERIATKANVAKLKYINDFCMREDISPTSVVTGYITSNKLKGIALVSVSNMEQLRDIVSASDYDLDQTVIGNLDSIR